MMRVLRQVAVCINQIAKTQRLEAGKREEYQVNKHRGTSPQSSDCAFVPLTLNTLRKNPDTTDIILERYLSLLYLK